MIVVEEIQSAAIAKRAASARDVRYLGRYRSRHQPELIHVYEIDGVLAATTNGDPVWGSEAEEYLEEHGIE